MGWFDHVTPCYAGQDKETHIQHQEFLENSLTGSQRICGIPSIIKTQKIGGTEITRVDAEEVVRDEGHGVPYENSTFGQELEMSFTSTKCEEKSRRATLHLPMYGLRTWM